MRNADLNFIRQNMSWLPFISGGQLNKLHLELMIAKLDGMADADDHLRELEAEMHRRIDRMLGSAQERALAESCA